MHPMHFVTLHWNGTAECFHSKRTNSNDCYARTCINTFTPIGKWMKSEKKPTATEMTGDIHTVETTFEYCGHIWFSLHALNVKMYWHGKWFVGGRDSKSQLKSHSNMQLHIIEFAQGFTRSQVQTTMIPPDTLLAYLRTKWKWFVCVLVHLCNFPSNNGEVCQLTHSILIQCVHSKDIFTAKTFHTICMHENCGEDKYKYRFLLSFNNNHHSKNKRTARHRNTKIVQ